MALEGSSNGISVRILHLADHSTRGGASRAAFRLHLALAAESDVASEFWGLSNDWLATHQGVSRLKATDSYVFKNSRPNQLALLIRHYLGSHVRLVFDFLFFRNVELEEQVRRFSPDLVVIHWVRARDVPLRSLRKIKKPITIVLHDARFLIGHRHYPESRFDRRRHLSTSDFLIGRLMRYLLRSAKVKLICPSEWMSSVARECGWSDKTKHTVPYPIDLEFWTPVEQRPIEQDSSVLRIGFGYAGQGSGVRKGEDVLFGALRIIENSYKLKGISLHVYLFGNARLPIDWNVDGSKTQFSVMGNLSDSELRDLYRRIDLIIVPSREENLAQVALEAQATGTPALVSSSTGLESTICDESGQVFRNGSVSDLALKIFWLSRHRSILNLQAIASREHALREFSNEAVTRKFLASVELN